MSASELTFSFVSSLNAEDGETESARMAFWW
jgi:hypothetical protein